MSKRAEVFQLSYNGTLVAMLGSESVDRDVRDALCRILGIQAPDAAVRVVSGEVLRAIGSIGIYDGPLSVSIGLLLTVTAVDERVDVNACVRCLSYCRVDAEDSQDNKK